MYILIKYHPHGNHKPPPIVMLWPINKGTFFA